MTADIDRHLDEEAWAMEVSSRSEDFKEYGAAAREKDDAIKYANSSLLERLIAIVDNFELGLEAARAEGFRLDTLTHLRARGRSSSSRTASSW